MATKTSKKTAGKTSAKSSKKTSGKSAKKSAKKAAKKSAKKSAGTRDDYRRAVDRVIERAAGDDRLLQRMASSFATNDVSQVRKILADYGDMRISEERARRFMTRFNREHRPNANTGTRQT